MLRNDFIKHLSKTASKLEPDYKVDSHEKALEEHEKNRSDNSSTMRELFSQAGAVERGNTKTMEKLFPGKHEKETSNVLMKVAQEQARASSKELGFFKTASSHFLAATFASFQRELDKITG